MSASALIFGMRLVCAIDRVEPPWAVIEWSTTGQFADMPLALIPPDSREGDRLIVRIQPLATGASRGQAQPNPVLHTPAGLLTLPTHAPITSDRKYRVQVRVHPTSSTTRERH